MKTKNWIERLWMVMGGLLFSMIGSFQSCSDCYRFFTIDRWLDFDRRWDGFERSDFLDEFIVGFIITFILVKSIKKYNSLK